MDALESVQRSEHTCASSVWKHTEPWSALTTRGGGHPKVRVGRSTRVRGECCVHPAPGAKRQRDTILESASSEKVDPVSVGGGSSRGVRVLAREECPLPRWWCQIRSKALSWKWQITGPGYCRRCFGAGGVVDVTRVEPFEVDWLNVVPSAGWSGRAGTRLIGGNSWGANCRNSLKRW